MSEGSVFCSGLDLQEILELGTPERHLMLLRDLVYAIERQDATTVSIITGKVVAGGIAIASCTDVALAQENALFEVPAGAQGTSMVNFLKTLVFAYRPQPTSDPLAGGCVAAREAKSLVDKTFLKEAADLPEVALSLIDNRRVPKRIISADKRLSIENALSEALRPYAVAEFLKVCARFKE